MASDNSIQLLPYALDPQHQPDLHDTFSIGKFDSHRDSLLLKSCTESSSIEQIFGSLTQLRHRNHNLEIPFKGTVGEFMCLCS